MLRLRRNVSLALLTATAAAALAVPAHTTAQSPAPAPLFEDRTAALGLTLGTADACWVDVDNDGWPDLCAGGAVWRNEKGKRFTRLAEIGGAVTAADFDNDGFVDLFSATQRKLYRNERGKGFSEFPLPELPKSVSRAACWGDFNGDGFVDLYVGGYEDWNAGITYPDLRLMNEGGKAFRLTGTDATFRTRGVTACDFDRDGYLEIYASHYRLQPNSLLRSDGKGGFADIAAARNAVATSAGFRGGHSIGAAWGDFDNDGEFDLFAGNFAHRDSRGDQPQSRFLRNLGPDKGFAFEDRGTCGVFYQESYASPAAGDFDNDGDLDLFFTTVYPTASFGKKNYPVLFRNDGAFVFTNATAAAGLAELPATYQAAWADFDRDGDLDLAAGGKLFVNGIDREQPYRRWLGVRLVGDGKRVNRSAIGAQVRIARGGKTFTRQVEAGTGEGNQNDLTLHFGLGDRERDVPVTLEVRWPDGTTRTVPNVRTNRYIEIKR
jgi:ASPIC and UnbV./FG-GAP repeat.